MERLFILSESWYYERNMEIMFAVSIYDRRIFSWYCIKEMEKEARWLVAYWITLWNHRLSAVSSPSYDIFSIILFEDILSRLLYHGTLIAAIGDRCFINVQSLPQNLFSQKNSQSEFFYVSLQSVESTIKNSITKSFKNSSDDFETNQFALIL